MRIKLLLSSLLIATAMKLKQMVMRLNPILRERQPHTSITMTKCM